MAAPNKRKRPQPFWGQPGPKGGAVDRVNTPRCASPSPYGFKCKRMVTPEFDFYRPDYRSGSLGESILLSSLPSRISRRSDPTTAFVSFVLRPCR